MSCGKALLHGGEPPTSKAKSKLAIVLVAVFVTIVISLLTVSLHFSQASGTQNNNPDALRLSEAGRLWSAGKQSEAAAAYRVAVDDHFQLLTKSQQSTALERIIESSIEHGGDAAANDYIRKAILFNVPLSLDTPRANALLEDEREKAKHNGNPWTDADAANKFVEKRH